MMHLELSLILLMDYLILVLVKMLKMAAFSLKNLKKLFDNEMYRHTVFHFLLDFSLNKRQEIFYCLIGNIIAL